MGQHDGSYKLFFSHPRMVADLLRGFVRAQWVAELDFASLEKVSTHGISDRLRRRESDVIWRIRWNSKERSCFVYLLIEFQSRPDRFMALRLQTYISLLHQDLVRRKQLTDDRKLSAVLPLVLYNGTRLWNAPANMSELIAEAPAELRRYCPQLCYLLIDEMALPESELKGARNLVALLIRLERCDRADDLVKWTGQLERELRAPAVVELRRDFAMWIHTVLAPSRFPGTSVPAIINLEEAWSMLAERARQWTREWQRQGLEKGLEKGLQQGRQLGLQEGEATIVCRLLKRRFGTLPRDVVERVTKARPRQLERWSERLLEASTLDDVFRNRRRAAGC